MAIQHKYGEISPQIWRNVNKYQILISNIDSVCTLQCPLSAGIKLFLMKFACKDK